MMKYRRIDIPNTYRNTTSNMRVAFSYTNEVMGASKNIETRDTDEDGKSDTHET